MRIAFVELVNFRKLKATRIDFAEKQTLFVGSNNSGKTTAMVALRLFLKERGGFTLRDVTLSNWRAIDAIGDSWMALGPEEAPDAQALVALLPALDVWFDVSDAELHRVSHMLPTLEWTGGKIGLRLRLEPKEIEKLVADYRDARQKAIDKLKSYKAKQETDDGFELWPNSLRDYLDRRFGTVLGLEAYSLDPNAITDVLENSVAQPQPLPATALPLEGNPLARLIHIREISAQRGFSDAAPSTRDGEDEEPSASGSKKHRLSDQLRAYYARHLDPADDPSDDDVVALGAFHGAQRTFDEKLAEGFRDAIGELEDLGYPGLTNPKLTISTRIRPTDGLNHPSAVQYDLGGAQASGLAKLPEEYNGLGFQNLISMVFLLMRFRADWMRAGKRGEPTLAIDDSAIEPLQLVLVEEPEAHLHAQVQQVFIRKAYGVLRKHEDLGKKKAFHTQLVVSTHSSHIAHEVEFACLRYFKRLPATDPDGVPNSVIANLSSVFGDGGDTDRFVARYLRTTHCDLFFADGVILVEGAAERMLVPHFIRRHHPVLSEYYISILEVGGSHAHRLRPLIELLSVPTLILTDLDAVDGMTGKGVRPQANAGHKSSNPVLKTWLPAREDIDDLLLAQGGRTKAGDGYGAVHVAYQQSIEVALAQGQEPEAVVPRTFEDAFVLANIDAMKKVSGVTMTNKIARIVVEAKTPVELCEQMFAELRGKTDKAGFALDMLDLPLELSDGADGAAAADQVTSLEALAPPTYVTKGLEWLETQMTPDGGDPTGDGEKEPQPEPAE